MLCSQGSEQVVTYSQDCPGDAMDSVCFEPCACTALSKHGVDVEPPFCGNFGTTVFLVQNGGLGVCRALEEGKRGSVMSVMVHSVHNNIVPHIATPSCLF